MKSITRHTISVWLVPNEINHVIVPKWSKLVSLHLTSNNSLDGYFETEDCELDNDTETRKCILYKEDTYDIPNDHIHLGSVFTKETIVHVYQIPPDEVPKAEKPVIKPVSTPDPKTKKLKKKGK